MVKSIPNPPAYNAATINYDDVRSYLSNINSLTAVREYSRKYLNKVFDNTKPTFNSAEVPVTDYNGASKEKTVIITFTEAIETGNIRPHDFTIRVTPFGSTSSINNVVGGQVSDDGKVILALQNNIPDNRATITVEYTKFHSDPTRQLGDFMCNKVDSFSSQSVTNNLPDVTSPVITSIATHSSTSQIIITFDENVEISTNYTGTDYPFKLYKNNSNSFSRPDSFGYNNNQVTLSFTTTPIGTTNQTLALSFDTSNLSAGENYNIIDTSPQNNTVSNFTKTTVTNNLDSSVPTISSIVTTASSEITITFDENVQAADINNAKTQFTLHKNRGKSTAANENPTNIVIANNTIILTVGHIDTTNNILELSYSRTSTVGEYITDTSGNLNKLADFTNVSIFNTRDSTRPNILSITTNSDTEILITLAENVQAADINNAKTQFTLHKNRGTTGAANENPSNIVIANNTITLTVASIGTGNNVLELSYTQTTTVGQYITDTSGSLNKLADFTNQSVANTRDSTRPQILSATTTSDTTIELTLSENITATDASSGLGQFTFYRNKDRTITTTYSWGTHVAQWPYKTDENPTDIVINNNTITLTVTSIGAQNNLLSIKYDHNSNNDFKDINNNILQSRNLLVITNNQDRFAEVLPGEYVYNLAVERNVNWFKVDPTIVTSYANITTGFEPRLSIGGTGASLDQTTLFKSGSATEDIYVINSWVRNTDDYHATNNPLGTVRFSTRNEPYFSVGGPGGHKLLKSLGNSNSAYNISTREGDLGGNGGMSGAATSMYERLKTVGKLWAGTGSKSTVESQSNVFVGYKHDPLTDGRFVLGSAVGSTSGLIVNPTTDSFVKYRVTITEFRLFKGTAYDWEAGLIGLYFVANEAKVPNDSTWWFDSYYSAIDINNHKSNFTKTGFGNTDVASGTRDNVQEDWVYINSNGYQIVLDLPTPDMTRSTAFNFWNNASRITGYIYTTNGSIKISKVEYKITGRTDASENTTDWVEISDSVLARTDIARYEIDHAY